jgi:tetratricopeptide (TPR) repeat protein
MTPGSLIYLMDLNNATKDPELDATGTLLRTQLRQSAHMQLLDDARLSRIRALIATKNADPATAERELALQAGASLVVFSTLTRTADSYDLAVEIQQPGENPSAVRNRWRRSWQARGKTQIFGTIHDAGVWIRTIAGESAVNLASHDVPPEEAASSSWEALSLYQQAQGFKGRRDVDSAIAMLRRAILIDPDFALARVRLADYLSGIRRQEEAYEQYQLAISAAAKRRLSNWEQLQLRGNYALDIGNYREAEGVFTELRSLYPHDYLALHNLAGSVRYQGRLEQSVQLELETLKRAADYTGAITAAVQDYLRLGRLDEAEVMTRRIESLGLPFMSAEYQGVVQIHRGNFPAARALFEKEATDPAPINRSRAASLLAALEAETGAYGRALTRYQDGLAADLAAGLPEQAAQKHLALAFLYFRKNDKAAARIHALEAVRRLRFLVVYRRAGGILARSGSPSEARSLRNELKRWPGPLADAARRYILGEVLLAERDYAGALREFRALDDADTPLLPREYLARAYAAAGDPERALFLYQSLLRSWQPFWLYADGELPALRTSVLLEYATMAGQHGHAEQARSALSQFSEIRRHADSDLPEAAAAARVAAAVTHAPTANRKDKP